MGAKLRICGWGAIGLLALYGATHLVSTLYFGWTNLAAANREQAPRPANLTAREEQVVSALTRILTEDGVGNGERWAQAIVRAAPTDDLGYIALVTAQVRRESHFLATDLEWLFAQLVPDLIHELGVPDPINTIGPMQVQRWTLDGVFERTLGRRLSPHEVKQLATDIEVGVAACVAVLDPIVRDHVPDRRVRGWAVSIGVTGLEPPGERTLARDWLGTLPTDRPRQALFQKLLSDVTRTPLALDGVLGQRSDEVAMLVASRLADPEREGFLVDARQGGRALDTVRRLWEKQFHSRAPESISPRIAHDPRVSFIFADFNSGRGASRTAALQFVLADLLGIDLAVDGKRGPLTSAAMRQLFSSLVPDERRRTDFLDLLDSGRKSGWVAEQALRIACRHWRARRGEEPPQALVPDLWHQGFAQQVKGIGRVSVEGYVAGSTAFFEDYFARLLTYTGTAAPL